LFEKGGDYQEMIDYSSNVSMILT